MDGIYSRQRSAPYVRHRLWRAQGRRGGEEGCLFPQSQEMMRQGGGGGLVANTGAKASWITCEMLAAEGWVVCCQG